MTEPKLKVDAHDGSDTHARRSLSDNKLRHVRAVAETMRETALANGMDADDADQMYLLELVHDVGYVCGATGHAQAGARMLALSGYAYSEEVRLHGRPVEHPSQALLMLWHADMSCDWQGRRVSYEERLKGVMERYGADSEQVRNAKGIIKMLEEMRELRLA